MAKRKRFRQIIQNTKEKDEAIPYNIDNSINLRVL